MQNPLVEFSLLCFVSMFTMTNPLGAVPIYTSFTNDLSAKESQTVAYKAVLTAFVLLCLFAIAGQLIFNFFSISIHSLKIVGGLIFLAMGWEMLQAKLNRCQQPNETKGQFIDDISITPLGVPMLCGPGAITNAIILMNSCENATMVTILFSSLTLVMLLSLLILISGKRLLAVLGNNGNKIMMRLMGLIVMVIAVEFFFAGLKPIVQDMMTK
ncbi:MAG: NAAT family transporter [Phycisphaerae bacterium]|nr:NAAT family transporter [Phycisphaerae bacterium]